MERQAFLVILHKYSESLQSLFNRLVEAHGDIYVHIDKKCKDSRVRKLLLDLPNVVIIPESYNVSWGGINMVKVMLSLLKEAFSAKHDYSHFVFLSGSDLPVASGVEIQKYFSKKSGIELMRSYSITKSGCEHCNSKIEKIYFFDNISKNEIFSKIMRAFASELMVKKRQKNYLYYEGKKQDICYGSQWFAITPDCVNYILNQVDLNIYLDYFKHTFAPDEMFFQTIIFNSKFKSKNQTKGLEPYNRIWQLFNYTFLDARPLNCGKPIESSVLRNKMQRLLKKFKNPNYYRHTNNNVLGGSIGPLTIQDYPDIISSEMPFCRKIDDKISAQLIEKLSQNN
ncbi:beta-1,6-N-acetylglucosaminyltransferase [Pediococcus inopinatus]|uniref:Peptide O-xylosyltransferase n=1 Tax=Pediococcus inopinatus TaxID=114090 RepID=A0ABZ0Q7S6_9LACO|nr:beta-1,6-N-acetylglucosaminyltransferase [Pediococcus inopinatus]WPC22384.1 beta-1,6-N-acetylglucosaminyltransferase [Pediococcus inopinatus]